MRSYFLSRFTDFKGQSVVELALVLPVLVVFMLGLVDLSRAIQAYNIISNMSREGASLAVRSTSLNHQDIMNSLANTAQPLSMGSKGMMYLTVVEGVEGSDPNIRNVVAWEKGSGPGSPVDRGTVSKIVERLRTTDKNTFYIFEVYYKYDTLFGPGDSLGRYSPQLHSVSVF